MPVPDFQTLMLPLLKLLEEKGEVIPREAAMLLANEFQLTPEERRQLLPSGKQEVFANRIGWARTFLKKAELLETPRRGLWRITGRGKEVLKKNPQRIDAKFLKQFPEFIANWGSKKKDTPIPWTQETDPVVTPEEVLESTLEDLSSYLEGELLHQVRSCTPEFFETLVVDLLIKMGYGGSRKDAGQAIGRSGDGGIDGIIKEDPLGLDVVYIQAKRWECNVGRPEIQKFAGALQGHRAKKGIFLTTADFSPDAKSYAGSIDSKIVLISGEELVRLMIQHDLGVNIVGTYHVKKIDADYFSDE
ncbi:MAG: restriction endonuclease [Candidatus Omnitrophica bacterium]|nr:restriction endonuclease [Candidatus Omnitrophota bacterium]